MEQPVATKKQPIKTKKLNTVGIRLERETHRQILNELSKVNKKQFGKRVRIDKLIRLAMTYITEADIQKLQQQSLSHQDRLKMQYKDHVSKNGNVSYDDFIGHLLTQKNS